MATAQYPVIPRVKVESAADRNVKQEAIDEVMASLYPGEDDDPLEAGDLNFSILNKVMAPIYLTNL
jgi:hypothetical protein